jgi:hypothetical protein
MWENVINCIGVLICLFRINYFAISLSQIDYQLLFNYFGINHSQIKE